MPNDKLSEFNEIYTQTVAVWGDWLSAADDDVRFYLGDQYTATEKGYLKHKRRNVLVFNKIRRIVKLITGYQRKNRLSFKVDPVEDTDSETASQWSQLIQHVVKHGGGYNVMSEGFEQGALKSGMCLIDPHVDFALDPLSGDILFNRIPYNRYLLDPTFTKRDLSDCNFILRRELFTKDFAKALFPSHASEIEKVVPNNAQDNKYTRAGYVENPYKKNMVRYDEYWKRTFKPMKMLVDRDTGMFVEVERDSQVRELVNRFPNLAIIDKYKKDVELTIFVEDIEVYNGPEPFGTNDYRFVPVMGFYDSEYFDIALKLQGIVRCMKDPQRESNKRRSKMLDILDSQLSSGWKAQKDSVINKEALYQTGQGQVIWTNNNEQVEKIPPADVPSGMFQMQQLMDQDVVDIPGANSELLGSVENEDLEVSALLAKTRQGQGLTILQDLFDNYRYAKELLGKKVMNLIRANYTPEKIQKIINRQPSSAFFNEDTGKYDIVLTEGVLSDSQKQMQFAQLVALKKIGVQIPDAAIIQASNLERKDELSKIVQGSQQQAQQQQQINNQQVQASTESLMAKTQKDLADAQKKKSEVVENLAQASLDRVLGIKAANDIETGKVESALSVVKTANELATPKEALVRR